MVLIDTHCLTDLSIEASLQWPRGLTDNQTDCACGNAPARASPGSPLAGRFSGFASVGDRAFRRGLGICRAARAARSAATLCRHEWWRVAARFGVVRQRGAQIP